MAASADKIDLEVEVKRNAIAITSRGHASILRWVSNTTNEGSRFIMLKSGRLRCHCWRPPLSQQPHLCLPCSGAPAPGEITHAAHQPDLLFWPFRSLIRTGGQNLSTETVKSL